MRSTTSLLVFVVVALSCSTALSVPTLGFLNGLLGGHIQAAPGGYESSRGKSYGKASSGSADSYGKSIGSYDGADKSSGSYGSAGKSSGSYGNGNNYEKSSNGGYGKRSTLDADGTDVSGVSQSTDASLVPDTTSNQASQDTLSVQNCIPASDANDDTTENSEDADDDTTEDSEDADDDSSQ